MKRFKEYVDIKNVHGSHAKDTSGFDDEGYAIIKNAHGSHVKSRPVNEESDTRTERTPLRKPKSDVVTHIDNWVFKNDENTHLGTSSGDQMENLHKLHPVNDEGKKAIKKYTQYSGDITNHFIDSHKKGVEPNLTHGGHNMQEFEKTFQPAKHDMHLYTGAGFDIRQAKPVGTANGLKVYHNPAHLSSSIEKHNAQFFAKDAVENKKQSGNTFHIMHWHIKKGNPISVVGNHGEYPNESEVVIPRTNAVKNKPHIVHFGTDTYNDDNNNTWHVHHVGIAHPKQQ